MSLAERSRRRVHDRLAALEEAFGVDRRIDRESNVPPGRYERTVERCEAGTVGGAGAWATNDDGAVLLVRKRPEGPWSEPSGKHEPGKSLAQTACREVSEETGVDCVLGPVALAQAVTVRDRDDASRPPVHRLVVVFHADYAGGTERPAEGEIAEVRWFDGHPDDLLYDALAELPIPAADT